MGIFDSDNPTVDDIANEFEKVWDELESEDDDDEDPFDPSDLFDQASETARDETIDTFEHIIDESCDNERCKQIRDELGIGGDNDSDPDDDENESTESSDDGEESETETGSGDGGGDDDSESGDADGGDDESNSEPWSDDTNIFGESI